MPGGYFLKSTPKHDPWTLANEPQPGQQANALIVFVDVRLPNSENKTNTSEWTTARASPRALPPQVEDVQDEPNVKGRPAKEAEYKLDGLLFGLAVAEQHTCKNHNKDIILKYNILFNI